MMRSQLIDALLSPPVDKLKVLFALLFEREQIADSFSHYILNFIRLKRSLELLKHVMG